MYNKVNYIYIYSTIIYIQLYTSSQPYEHGFCEGSTPFPLQKERKEEMQGSLKVDKVTSKQSKIHLIFVKDQQGPENTMFCKKHHEKGHGCVVCSEIETC